MFTLESSGTFDPGFFCVMQDVGLGRLAGVDYGMFTEICHEAIVEMPVCG